MSGFDLASLASWNGFMSALVVVVGLLLFVRANHTAMFQANLGQKSDDWRESYAARVRLISVVFVVSGGVLFAQTLWVPTRFQGWRECLIA